MNDNITFSDKRCTRCGALRLTSGVCSLIPGANGKGGCPDPTYDYYAEKYPDRFPAPAQGTPEPPKVEEFVQTFLSRLAGLTEEQSSNVAETLSHMLRPYFPPASQTRFIVVKSLACKMAEKMEPVEWHELPELRREHYMRVATIAKDEFERATPASTARTDALAKLRADGWMVAVHNDYRVNGKFHTFWLLTRVGREGQFVKGEGETDEDALAQIVRQLASHAAPGSVPQAPERPKIICLCGSTRFIEQFAIQTWELELKGNIVLGCTLLPGWYCPVRDHFAESLGVKEQRDNHHLQKIDLADEVLVLNIGGYIGESTRREIEYAAKNGKPINYLEPAGAAQPGDAPQKEKP